MASKRKRRSKTPAAEPVRPPASNRRPLLFATLGGAAIVAIVAVAGIAALLLSGGGSNGDVETDGQLKAVIVDQLQLTQPDPDFVSKARDTLGKAGYSVDYIPGENVTVDTYRTLASRDYDLIILRSHAGLTVEVDEVTHEPTNQPYVSMFTNEKFEDNKYPDQLNNLGKATYDDGSGGFFGIGPNFIRSMPGNFKGATVILMGCDGLHSDVTGQAFLDHGASAFVSWTDKVSGPHTDEATNVLLEHYVTEGMPIKAAVSQTANEVGPDPAYAGALLILTG
jgi:hypothetical protein